MCVLPLVGVWLWFCRLMRNGAQSAIGAALVVTLVFLLAFPAFGWWGLHFHGLSGVSAAVVAGLVCWVAGLVALATVAVLNKPQQVVHAVAMGMLLRMVIPMAAGMLLVKASAPLAEAGVFGMIVGFYLIGLVVETYLAVQLVAGPRNQ